MQRTTKRVPLPNNSLFVNPWSASQPDLSSHWHLHLSLTFSLKSCRTKGSESAFFGQSTTGKTRAEAWHVVHGGEEAERLLAAFGVENHQSVFGG